MEAYGSDKGQSCEAPSGGSAFGVGLLGALAAPNLLVAIPAGLLLRHYGSKDCVWWGKSAGTGVLVGTAIKTLAWAGAAAMVAGRANARAASIGGSTSTSMPFSGF